MPFQATLTKYSTMSSRLLKNWRNTIALYGGVTVIVGLYVTDWKVTNAKIPFYGNKFDDDGNL